MKLNQICPVCSAYMLQHQTLHGWRKCPTCGYCHDQNGNNKISNCPVIETARQLKDKKKS